MMTIEDLHIVLASVALACWVTFIMWGMYTLETAVIDDDDDE